MKKTLSIVLTIFTILALLCACVPSQTPEETLPDLTYTEENGILLSGENKYRVVYSEAVASAVANRLANKLTVVDPDDTVKYSAVLDTSAPDDGTPEILLGLTNRGLSTEARNMLESGLDYAIVVGDNKIAIYAVTETRLSIAIQKFTSQIATNEIDQVFYTRKDTIHEKVTNFAIKDLKIENEPINNYSLIVSKDATTEERNFAITIASEFISRTGAILDIKDDTTAPSEYEILVGRSSRPESIQSTFDVGGDFNVQIKGNKLCIAANPNKGYDNTIKYIQSILGENISNITAKEHSTRALSFNEISTITVGAAYIKKENDNLCFYKCTDEQMKAWESTHGSTIGARAKNSTGVRFDFYTDSSFIGINIGEKSGTKFELHINGEYQETLSLMSSSLKIKTLDNSKGENRVTIIFPSQYDGSISTVQLSDGATVRACDYDTNILFMGDSITQGVGTNDDSHSFAYNVTKYFNANSIIQGVGGGRFDAKTLDPKLAYDPDVIIIAFGCNDWSAYRNNEATFRSKLTEYLDKVDELYGDKIVIGITPIPRMEDTSGSSLSFEKAREIIEEEYTKRGFIVIDGFQMVPADKQYYNDALHPNTKGFDLYGENLCKAIEQYINA